MNTRHAQIRSQQRGIPPMMYMLLDQYGHAELDGHGAVLFFLDKKSIRDLRRRPVARLSEWLDAYKVVGENGQTITIGHRTQRVWRK